MILNDSFLKVKKIESLNKELKNIIKKDLKHFTFKEGSYKILIEDKVVGFSDMYLYDDYIVLKSLEILEKYKNKGIGKKYIKHLFDNYNINRICGISKPGSVYFYNSFDNSIIEHNEYDDETYFTIFK